MEEPYLRCHTHHLLQWHKQRPAIYWFAHLHGMPCNYAVDSRSKGMLLGQALHCRRATCSQLRWASVAVRI